jgi:hypothetical protein
MESVLLNNEHGFRLTPEAKIRHLADDFVRFLTDGSSRDAKSRGH